MQTEINLLVNLYIKIEKLDVWELVGSVGSKKKRGTERNFT